MAVTIEEVRALALTLPRTHEALVRDRVKFRVGRIVYVALSPDETVMGFSYPKEERAALVASQPEKFAMPAPRDERFNWVRVRLSAIDAEELREIVTEAWRMVVPARVATEHLRATSAPEAEAPTTETPPVVAPATETPPVVAPATETPPVVAPATEPLVVEAPITEPLVVEAPTTEPLVVEAPTTEPPVVDVPTFADLRATAQVFNGFTGVDRSWLALRERTHPGLDPARVDHRDALLRWLNSWGCRIRYPRAGEPAPFDTGLAGWWATWSDTLPRGTLAGLDDVAVAAFGRAYGDLVTLPVTTGRSVRSLGPTAAAKALYALRPEAIMAWDAAIAERLHGTRDAAAFTRHLILGRDWARAVLAETGATEAALPGLVGRPDVPLSKILDEFLYVRLSMRSSAP
ncbi:MmcQ/YjbR family DNA-binding protein [Streptomyces narbonensis]|uniref:MmcQ/YjbR family DNA-binding protein n=1 Tax=Streptomyces narbonensis TaxID=67333 RepID=UPI0034030028